MYSTYTTANMIMIIYRNINGIDFAVNTEKSASLLCEPEVAEQTKGSIYAFIDYLYDKKQTYTPMVATWEITNICNFSCKFCYINSERNTDKKFIPLEKAIEVIDDLANAGFLLVYLTGGEILSHPNFKEIYMLLKNKGIYVILLTNLSLLDNQTLELFKTYPPMRITTSLYGVSEKQFIEVTNNKNIPFDKIMNNILLVKENGINITVQTPINKLTIPEYEKMAQWCYDNGIVYKSDNDLTDSYLGEGRQDFAIDRENFLEIKDRIKLIDDENIIIDYSQKPKCEFGHRKHFDCISGKHTFAISYDLHLRPCFNIWENEGPWFDASQSMQKGLSELSDYIEKKRKITIDLCKGCNAHEFCSECMMTQNKHRDNLEEYMHNACKNNRLKLEKYKNKI